MIYLICSSAIINFEKRELGFIYKIGYCGEDSKKARINTYLTENPTMKVLYLIPGGTEQDERNLHHHFRKFKVSYGREWFSEAPEILEFFQSHTTKESLEELQYVPPSRIVLQEKLDYKKEIDLYTRSIKSILFPKDPLKHSEIMKELSGVKPDNLRKYVEDNYPPEVLELHDELSSLPPLESVSPYLQEFNSYTTFVDRMKYLCRLKPSIDSDIFDKLLTRIPSEFENYITSLGISKIGGLGYQKSKIVSEFQKITGDFNLEDELSNIIYFTFEVGKKYSNIEIKDILSQIYSRIEYSKSPKATDLHNYYKVKPTKVLNKKIGKKENGLEILEKISGEGI